MTSHELFTALPLEDRIDRIPIYAYYDRLVTDQDMCRYLEKIIRSYAADLRYDPSSTGLARSTRYLEQAGLKLPEAAILVVHEKAEIAALRNTGNAACLFSDCPMPIQAYSKSHAFAVEAERTFISEMQKEFGVNIDRHHLLVGYPFYINDLLKTGGGVAWRDRMGRLFPKGNDFNLMTFRSTLAFYQSEAFSYDNPVQEIMEIVNREI